MIWSIAWRNVWRNKVRSLIVILAVAIGLFAGVFSTAFFMGMAETRVSSAIKSQASHIQLHHPDYHINNDIHLVIKNADSILTKIERQHNDAYASRRIIGESMVSTAHGTRGVNLLGIDIEKEKKVTDINRLLLEGTYLESKSKRIPPVLISSKLAEKLKLKLRSKLKTQLVDVNGDISYKAYKVCGIYKTNNSMYDEMTAFVNFKDLRQQLSVETGVAHEIAVYLEDDDHLDNVLTKLSAIFPDIKVQSWKELNKELALVTESFDQYMYIFVMIILLALCFGIINTMLMVVLERTKEIGMLRAIGMNRRRVFSMIVLESVFLTLSGGLLGIIIGTAVTKYFEKNPIMLDMFKGFEQYGYSTEVYTTVSISMIITITILVIVLGVLSAVYPARKASKLNPADAIRME